MTFLFMKEKREKKCGKPGKKKTNEKEIKRTIKE
jgi:hypothetical protein